MVCLETELERKKEELGKRRMNLTKGKSSVYV